MLPQHNLIRLQRSSGRLIQPDMRPLITHQRRNLLCLRRAQIALLPDHVKRRRFPGRESLLLGIQQLLLQYPILHRRLISPRGLLQRVIIAPTDEALRERLPNGDRP